MPLRIFSGPEPGLRPRPVAVAHTLSSMARRSILCMVHRYRAHMRTTIMIDDDLMAAALEATGLSTKREVVEEGLRTLLRLKQQTELRKLRGKYEWVGDLDAKRRDR